MKVLVLLAIFANVSASDIKLDKEWDEYKGLFTKSYQTKSEESKRRLIWEKNLKKIETHNNEADQGKHTYRQKMNRFGDLSNEEFRMRMNGYNLTRKFVKTQRMHNYKKNNTQIPESVDWRTKGYVTYVKDQGQCGSCWAFSAVASLEGQHFKASGKLVPLSEQNLVDCSVFFGNFGCNGGFMTQAFAYIKFNRGIDTEETYSYTAKEGLCQFKRANVGATCSGHVEITKDSEDDLVNAVANIGPISVAIDASLSSFQFYYTGIYYEPNCSSEIIHLDHGVAVVGYGSLGAGQDYYIVKNSWGQTWGENGYILMSRNRNNNCGIASQGSYPLV